LAKGDIAWLIVTSDAAHSCHGDILCHIRQVAARVVKLVLGCICDPHFGGRGGRTGSAIISFERAMVV